MYESNQDDGTVEQVFGGPLRYTPAAADLGAIGTPVHETSRHYGSANTQEAGVGLNPGDSGKSVMSTLRNAVGTQRIDSTSSVEIDGMRTDLRTAEALGYIRKTANGYEDVNPGVSLHAQQQQQQQTQAQDAAGDSISIDANFNDLIAPVPQHAFDSAVAHAANAVLDTDSYDGWKNLSRTLAQSSGIEVEAAEELVEKAYAKYEADAARAISGFGIGSEEKWAMYQWAQTAKPDDLRAATQTLTMQGSTAGFKALAIQFNREQSTASMPIYRKAGFDCHLNEKGELMVSKPGHNPVRAKDLK